MSIERVTLSQVWRGQIIQNVIHFSNPDAALSGTQIADKIESDWIPRLKIRQTPELVYTQIKVQRVQTAPPAPFIRTVSTAGTGGASAQALTFQCIVIQWLSSLGGRHGRGRL